MVISKGKDGLPINIFHYFSEDMSVFSGVDMICWDAPPNSEQLHRWKPTWHWKIPIFNRKYVFKRWIFHCHIGFRRCMLLFLRIENPKVLDSRPSPASVLGENSQGLADPKLIVSRVHHLPGDPLLYELLLITRVIAPVSRVRTIADCPFIRPPHGQSTWLSPSPKGRG